MTTEARWSRLAANDRLGKEGLERLRHSHVAVVGAGVLGGAILSHLVLLGIETTIIDRDVVTEENLGNQGFAEALVGMPKATARALSLAGINHLWRAHTVNDDLARVGMGRFSNFDLGFCAVDSAKARTWMSEIAVRVGMPWCDGAVDPSGRPFGRVACYDPRGEDSACYLCPHDAASLSAVNHGAPEPCPRASGRDTEAPTTFASSMLAACVAGLQVSWGVEMLLGCGDAPAGSEAYIDLEGLALRRHRLARNPNCLFDHRRFNPVMPLGAGVGELSVADALGTACRELGGPAQLRIWRDAVVSELRCGICGAARRPFRLLRSLCPLDTRCTCGGDMAPPAEALFDRFGSAEAAPFAGRSFAEMGLPEGEIIGACRDKREIYLRFE